MFEYVLVVYMNKQPEYIGHFTSCAAANQYVEEHYKHAEYTSCLYEDYINLPKDLVKKEIK